MLFNSAAEDRIHWAVGDFWDASAGGTGSDPIQHNFTARLAGAPVFDKKEKTLLHVGASFQMRSPDSETDRFRVRPETPFTPRTQDTGTLSVDSEDILGLEFAVARGPISLQAEWYKASIEGHPDVVGAPSPNFKGYYVGASWFVTGEHRPYKGGKFDRVKPESNFKGKSGTGALELAARYSALDLEDDTVMGGVGHDTTFGVNWYLNPNARVMLDYVLYTLHHVGDVNSVVVRFQVDF
jgi:phosphate-selective porin OprO/OprP